MQLNPVSSPKATKETTNKGKGETALFSTTTANNVGPRTLNASFKDAKFVIGSSDPLRHRQRRKRYRPQSKTLLARKQKREEIIKRCDEEILNRLLQQNKNLFAAPNTDSSQSSFTTTGLNRVAKVNRKLGVNQKASRMPMKEITQRKSYEEHTQKKQVSFNSAHTSAQTPQHNNRPRVKRKQTPGPGQGQHFKITNSSPASLGVTSTTSSTGSTLSKTSSNTLTATPVYNSDEMKSHLDGGSQFDGIVEEYTTSKSTISIDLTGGSRLDQNMNFGDVPEGSQIIQSLEDFERRVDSEEVEKVNTTESTNNDSPTNSGPISKKARWDPSMFAYKANKWKCSACLGFVSNDLVKCSSCETPKPGSNEPSTSGTKSIGEDKVVSSGNFNFGASSGSTSGATTANLPPVKESKFFGNSSVSGGSGTFTFGAPPGNTPSTSDSSAKVTVPTQTPVVNNATAQKPEKDVTSFQSTTTFVSGAHFGTPGPKDITKAAAVNPFAMNETSKPVGGNKFNFGAPTGNLPTPNLDSAKSINKGFQFGTSTSNLKGEASTIGEKIQNPGTQSDGDDDSRRKKRRNVNNEESLGSIPSTAPPAAAPNSNFMFGATKNIASTSAAVTSSDDAAPKSANTTFIFGSETPSSQATSSQSVPSQPSSAINPFGSKTPVATSGTTTSFVFGSNAGVTTATTPITFGANTTTTFVPTPAPTTTNSSNTT